MSAYGTIVLDPETIRASSPDGVEAFIAAAELEAEMQTAGNARFDRVRRALWKAVA